MTFKNILTGTSLITISFILLAALSGCIGESVETEKPSKKIQKLITEAKISKKSVSISAAVEKTEGGQSKITLTGHNPEKKVISGAKIWLTYNPTQLKADNLNTKVSPFDLDAPGENTIDSDTGVIKIGKSKAGEGITNENFIIAEFTVKKSEEGHTTIDVFNYQEDETGKTQILTVVKNKPRNILKRPEIPFITVK